MNNSICQLCGLECKTEIHHLIPQNVSRSNKYPKALKTDVDNYLMICKQCHETLHALYTNQELRDMYSTRDSILESEKFKKFISWRRKHPDFNGHSKMSNVKKYK